MGSRFTGPVQNINALPGGDSLVGGVSFNYDQLFLPGDYRLVTYARFSGSDWAIVDKGSYSNEAHITVEDQAGALRLISEFKSEPGLVEVDDLFDVNAWK